VERRFRGLTCEEAARLCDDQAIKRIVGRELVYLKEVDAEVLVKAAQVTGDDILRHFRDDYLQWATDRQPDRARLIIRFDPDQLTDLGSYRDGEGRRALYCTADIWNGGPATARRCFGLLGVLSPEGVLRKLPRSFKLHVAVTSTSPEDDVAEPVDIPPEGNRRLDILFAPLPQHHTGGDISSGVVASLTVSPDKGSRPKATCSSQMTVGGCFIATPQALRDDRDVRNQAYLSPGKYTALVWVTCDNPLGEIPTLGLEIVSPRAGEQLVVTRLPRAILGTLHPSEPLDLERR